MDTSRDLQYILFKSNIFTNGAPYRPEGKYSTVYAVLSFLGWAGLLFI